MPTPGGLPRVGDAIYNSHHFDKLEFRVKDRSSRTYPYTLTIARADGKEMPPGFDRRNMNPDGSYRLGVETKWTLSAGGWEFSNPEFPDLHAPMMRCAQMSEAHAPHTFSRQSTAFRCPGVAGEKDTAPQYTVSITEREEYFSFQPQRRITTIPSRSVWQDYMEPHNTPASAYYACDRSQKAFGENVEWRVVLKRTTVEVVHRTS